MIRPYSVGLWRCPPQAEGDRQYPYTTGRLCLARGTQRGVQRGVAPLRFFLSPKIGGKGVEYQ